MRELVYHVATSLDGFIARTDHSWDCFPMEGDHVEDFGHSLRNDYDTVLMGRRTYEVALRAGVTNPYPWLKTFVVSNTLERSPDPAVTLLRGREVDRVRELRRQPGKPIYFAGGGALARTLFQEGVIDSVHVKINPFLLGQGIPMLTALGEPPVRLALRSTKTYRSSVVLLRYEVPEDRSGQA